MMNFPVHKKERSRETVPAAPSPKQSRCETEGDIFFSTFLVLSSLQHNILAVAVAKRKYGANAGGRKVYRRSRVARCIRRQPLNKVLLNVCPRPSILLRNPIRGITVALATLNFSIFDETLFYSQRISGPRRPHRTAREENLRTVFFFF